MQLIESSTVEDKISSQVIADAEIRVDCLNALQLRMDASFQSVNTEYFISEITEDGDTIIIDVYEWNTIEYKYDDMKQSDVMGFGTDHTLYLEKDEDGSYIIAKDSFDEQEIVGMCSTDIVEDDVEKVNNNIVALEIQSENAISPLVYYSYDANAAIAYANTWCGQSVAGTSSVQNPTRYNPAYYYARNDCANFVSQCVHAGGVSTIGVGSYSTGWYYTVPPEFATLFLRLI